MRTRRLPVPPAATTPATPAADPPVTVPPHPDPSGVHDGPGRRKVLWSGAVLCLALFSALPVRARWVPVADRRHAAVALAWLPLLGVAFGAAAGGLAVGVHRAGPLLGAVLAVLLLAALTRGLHLDGLADLADGLGSRRPAGAAQEIMRRSDIGPFGVATLVLTLLVDVAAIAAVLPRLSAAGSVLMLACAVGASRAAAVVLAGPGLPPARPDGFGALVTGSARPVVRAGAVLLPVALAVGGGDWAGLTVGQLVATAIAGPVGVAVGYALAWHAVRRLGGVSGDVYGASIEVAGAVALVICAVAR